MTYISRPDEDLRQFRGEVDILTEDELLRSFGRQYLIDGFLAYGELAVAWGPPKDGAKTAFWLRAARRLSQGLPIAGRAGHDGAPHNLSRDRGERRAT